VISSNERLCCRVIIRNHPEYLLYHSDFESPRKKTWLVNMIIYITKSDHGSIQRTLRNPTSVLDLHCAAHMEGNYSIQHEKVLLIFTHRKSNMDPEQKASGR
jgi:hypothetical protein